MKSIIGTMLAIYVGMMIWGSAQANYHPIQIKIKKVKSVNIIVAKDGQ